MSDNRERPVISVVMPAYNAAHYIEQAIRSVQAQTMENWELIVVDDCSTDNTIQLVQKIAVEDDRIHLLLNDVNQGAAAAGIVHWMPVAGSTSLFWTRMICGGRKK